MKIRSPYRRPSRRISRRNDGMFFQSESPQENFFNPSGDVHAKEGEEEASMMAKKEEEEEPVQAKEEEEETPQAKEKEEEEQPAQAKRMSRESFQAKCHCGGTCSSCSGSKKGERQEKKIPKVEMTPPTSTKPGQQQPQPTLNFGGCTPKQETEIRAALSSASVLAKKAVNFMGPLIALGPSGVSPQTLHQYESWFGTYDPNLALFVHSAFVKIKGYLASGNITFHCDPHCDPTGKKPPVDETEEEPGGNGTLVMDLTAYVFKGAPVEIFLCPPFWGAASQGGIIVHELAHESNNQITDHAYGINKCRQLAVTSPMNATRNADTYQFFVETLP